MLLGKGVLTSVKACWNSVGLLSLSAELAAATHHPTLCVCLCNGWYSSEIHEVLSGVTEQPLKWHVSILFPDWWSLYSHPSFIVHSRPCRPIHIHINHMQATGSPPEEMSPTVGFKWPRKQNCHWVINETNTHMAPLSFSLPLTSLTQHKWSHRLSHCSFPFCA